MREEKKQSRGLCLFSVFFLCFFFCIIFVVFLVFSFICLRRFYFFFVFSLHFFPFPLFASFLFFRFSFFFFVFFSALFTFFFLSLYHFSFTSATHVIQLSLGLMTRSEQVWLSLMSSVRLDDLSSIAAYFFFPTIAAFFSYLFNCSGVSFTFANIQKNEVLVCNILLLFCLTYYKLGFPLYHISPPSVSFTFAHIKKNKY